MLIGIDPLLTGPLLAALDRLGHGDRLVIADANFPAHSTGSEVLALPGIGSPAALAAIATVFPIEAEGRVRVMASPEGALPIHEELVRAASVHDVLEREEIERFAFYEAARGATVALTGETRPYGNAILVKGVVAPPRG